tara:strand:- start:528 stop:710 length:183 start_codon:yes stop_codon:yes gene_type:complete
MKKFQIKPKEYLKDLNSILDLVDKIDNLDPETTDLKALNKIIKRKKTSMKNKYKDLDTKK